MYNVRRRLVNFRVTDQEFDQLKTASSVQGARCLSDYARSVILNPGALSPPGPGSGDALTVLERRLSTLEFGLARLERAMARANPLLTESKK